MGVDAAGHGHNTQYSSANRRSNLADPAFVQKTSAFERVLSLLILILLEGHMQVFHLIVGSLERRRGRRFFSQSLS